MEPESLSLNSEQPMIKDSMGIPMDSMRILSQASKADIPRRSIFSGNLFWSPEKSSLIFQTRLFYLDLHILLMVPARIHPKTQKKITKSGKDFADFWVPPGPGCRIMMDLVMTNMDSMRALVGSVRKLMDSNRGATMA